MAQEVDTELGRSMAGSLEVGLGAGQSEAGSLVRRRAKTWALKTWTIWALEMWMALARHTNTSFYPWTSQSYPGIQEQAGLGTLQSDPGIQELMIGRLEL